MILTMNMMDDDDEATDKEATGTMLDPSEVNHAQPCWHSWIFICRALRGILHKTALQRFGHRGQY